MHKAVFHFGHKDVILFKNWVLETPRETFFTCLFFVLLGVCYQGIKFARQLYGRKCKNITCKRYILSKGHVLQSLLYIVQFLWGYSLMLSVMTFNVWLMVAVMTGFGLGYFFFGWAEYEDRVAANQFRNSSSECGKECKTVCSTSNTQELLLNHPEEIEFKLSESPSIMKCKCNDSEL